MRRTDCHERIKRVEREYHAARQTVRAFIRLAQHQPQVLDEHGFSLSDLRRMAGGLHDLYFARMFAAFESLIRDDWRTSVRDTKPATEQLLASVGARRGVEQDVTDTVQEIRNFRNSLVHDEQQASEQFDISVASQYLNRYIARLPLDW